jgi:hypothetical protein
MAHVEQIQVSENPFFFKYSFKYELVDGKRVEQDLTYYPDTGKILKKSIKK